MPATIEGFQYDIFISYRQKDNKRDRWVTEFVKALQDELDATFKEDVTIYFDENPHDGLLETYSVNKSLALKLKSLIFIPIISQTYCDPKSFAWQHELCAFNKIASEDQFGRDVKLANGNISSRILPVKIHDLDADDKLLLEHELGGVLRAVDFTYKEAGVNRPLRSNEERPDHNQNQTAYRNQLNKIANAVKEMIVGLKNFECKSPTPSIERRKAPNIGQRTPVSFANFWQELKRRRVIRVGTVYGIAGWVILQIASTVFAPLHIPDWALTFFIVLILLGFPIAMILAWAFELSPDGTIRATTSLKEEDRVIRNKFPKIKVTIVVVLIILACAGIYLRSYYHPAGSTKSIAVLPFVNMSNDPEQDYFSDGLTEGILNSLAQLKDLKVPARTSSFQFRGANDLREVGKKLNVQTVLEGSVQRQGERIRITAQLINVEDGYHFWSKQYDVKAENIFEIQDKIANAIAEKLEVTLSGEKKEITSKKLTANKEAYELYLKGRFFWNQRNAPALKKGIEFFRQAIEIDPLFAAAYSGVADCYTALGYGSFLAPNDAVPKAKAAAVKAMQLDSTLAETHASIGYFKFYYDWDWSAAEQEFKTAINLNPSYENAYDYYGYLLTAMQRYDEAKTIFAKAKELDPLSVRISADMGFSLYYSRNFDLAIKELMNSLELDSKSGTAHLWLGRVYQAKKMYPQAIMEYRKTLNAIPEWTVALAGIGNVYGIQGKRAEALQMLDILSALSTKKYVTSYGVALVHAGLGDKDNTFLWLNKAFEERSNWLVWIQTDPRLSLIRSDPRYNELVEKVGLPH